MVSYSGGKFRTCHLLAPAILKAVKSYGGVKGYCEPFCGMCSVLKHIVLPSPEAEYLAGDLNANIVEMWNQLQDGWVPPKHDEVDKELYNRLKASDDVSALKGFYLLHGNSGDWGHSVSYSTTRPPRKTSDELEQIVDYLRPVEFSAGAYTQYSKLEGFCIYVDPPYPNTYSIHKQPDGSTRFDHEAFNEWCVVMAKSNLVIVSGYDKPNIPCRLIYTCRLGRVRQGKALPLEKLYKVL